MSDVEAVIELAKNMFQKKDIWRYCLDFFNKSKDESRINSIKENFQVDQTMFKICLMLSNSFGSDNNYMVPVIHIGQSIPYKNQTLWMRLDIDDLPYINSEIDFKDTFVIRKRSADALIVLPSLERFWNKMPPSLQESAKNNMEKIKQKKQRFFDFIQYHQEYKYPFIPDLDPDAALYQDGFFSFQEKKESSLFHKFLKSLQSDTQAYEILDKIKSPRIEALAGRILYRNFKNENRQSSGLGQLLSLNKLRSSLEEDQIIGYKNDIKFNCRQGLQELKKLEHEIVNPDKETKKMFCWIKDHIKNL
jgi:exodeoxyribonuclease-1